MLTAIISLETKEIIPDTKIVTKKIVTTQRIVLFRSFLAELASDFDTVLIPFKSMIKITVAGRINLTA